LELADIRAAADSSSLTYFVVLSRFGVTPPVNAIRHFESSCLLDPKIGDRSAWGTANDLIYAFRIAVCNSLVC
jgi:hypothetical protein